MKLKIMALGLLLSSASFADDVYIYSWESSQNGRAEPIQRMYSSTRGLLMEDSNSGSSGIEVVVLNEGVMIMNDVNERSSMILDPDNLPSIGDLLSGAGANNSNTNSSGNGNTFDSAEISAAIDEANAQYQQALQDMTPEEREAMNDLLNGGTQLQQQMQEAYQQAMADATPEERQAMQDLFGGNDSSGGGGILGGLGGLFGGGNANDQSSNSSSQSDSGGIASAIGGLFGGGRRTTDNSQQSTAQAAEEASSSVSSALSSLGGLFGGRKELAETDTAVPASSNNVADDVVNKDGDLFAGLSNLFGGQSEPPQFTETGNSGNDNGMRWEEVQMTVMGNTSTYRMVNIRDIDGGEQLINHYRTMTDIYERMMSNMGLGGLMQGLGIWPQEISDYMTQNRKFPIHIEDGSNITRLTNVERGTIDGARFGAQYPVRSLF